MPSSIASRRSLHPLIIIAAVAVILFCGAAMAGIMGWLPNSTGTTVQAIDHPGLASSEQLIARQAKPPAQPAAYSQPASRASLNASTRLPASSLLIASDK